jgi:hypothetical protein
MSPANRERATAGALALWMAGVLAWHAVRLLQAFTDAHGPAISSALRRLLGG